MKYEHARLLIQGKTPQDLLADRIRSDGAIIGKTLKVNAFINHQVDCHLMSVCGHELARRFRGLEVTKVLSCPGSGVMPAQVRARVRQRWLNAARPRVADAGPCAASPRDLGRHALCT